MTELESINLEDKQKEIMSFPGADVNIKHS